MHLERGTWTTLEGGLGVFLAYYQRVDNRFHKGLGGNIEMAYSKGEKG